MDRVIVISFHEDILKHIRTAGKIVETGLIYTKHPDPLKSALELNARYVLPMYLFTHTRNVEKAHQNNLKVIVWTINTETEAMEYFRKKVDGIATDKPDIFRDI
jgi:glycerophosphoryl diester phosphodiesterase